MSAARISSKWATVPLIVWAIGSCIAFAMLWSSGEFRASANARELYDSGTRAAIAGDHAKAVLDLRRAQRVSPGIVPIGDSFALAQRIDANLTEARARVAAARVEAASAADGSSATKADTPADSVAPAVKVPGLPKAQKGERLLSDRLLAMVRSVPWSARLFVAAMLIALLVALAATRSFCVAAGRRAWPGGLGVAMIGLIALGAAGFAVVDRVLDARHVEAVLVRAEVARSGPDDLTYPPAVAAAFPPGTEVMIVGTNDDGRWVRVVQAGSPRMGGGGGSGSDGGLWLPRSAIERVNARDGEISAMW